MSQWNHQGLLITPHVHFLYLQGPRKRQRQPSQYWREVRRISLRYVLRDTPSTSHLQLDWLLFVLFFTLRCGAAEATGLGFVCFVINPCVLSANRVNFGLFFCFINFQPQVLDEHTTAYVDTTLTSCGCCRKLVVDGSLGWSVLRTANSLNIGQGPRCHPGLCGGLKEAQQVGDGVVDFTITRCVRV